MLWLTISTGSCHFWNFHWPVGGLCGSVFACLEYSMFPIQKFLVNSGDFSNLALSIIGPLGGPISVSPCYPLVLGSKTCNLCSDEFLSLSF